MEHLRPRSTMELVDAAFQLMRARFGALATGSALVMIPVTAVGFANTYILLARAQAAAAAGSTAGVPRSTVWSLMLAGMLVSFIGFVFGFAAMIHVAARAYLGEPAELGAGLARARQRFRLLLLTALGKYGMVVGCVMIGALLLGLVTSRVPFLMWVMLPALIVFVAFLLVRWSMSGAAIVLEEPRGVSAALDRSIVLTRGGFLRLTAIFGIALVVAYAASLSVSYFGMSLLRSFALVQLANSLVWFAIYPLLAVLVAVTYYDLRIRNEGFDLELMAGGLGDAATLPDAGATTIAAATVAPDDATSRLPA